jgi:hypothetical protein
MTPSGSAGEGSPRERGALLAGIAAVLLAIAVLLTGGASAGAHGGRVRNCKGPEFDPHGALLARGTSCIRARRVIKGFGREVQERQPPFRVRGFWCVSAFTPHDNPVVRCHRGWALVRYYGQF